MISKAVEDILLERQRQIDVEGFDAAHDDEHDCAELAQAAACYADMAHGDARAKAAPPIGWPFDARWWRPKSERRDLVRAAALLIAEIERLDRRLDAP